jgi:hypothetical protein
MTTYLDIHGKILNMMDFWELVLFQEYLGVALGLLL